MVRQPGHDRVPRPQQPPVRRGVIAGRPATKAYVDGVTALTLDQQAAIYGNVYANQSQQRLDAEAKLGINLDDFDKAEQDFLIALAAGGELVTTLSP